jgi:hypothetical protein
VCFAPRVCLCLSVEVRILCVRPMNLWTGCSKGAETQCSYTTGDMASQNTQPQYNLNIVINILDSSIKQIINLVTVTLLCVCVCQCVCVCNGVFLVSQYSGNSEVSS